MKWFNSNKGTDNADITKKRAAPKCSPPLFQNQDKPLSAGLYCVPELCVSFLELIGGVVELQC